MASASAAASAASHTTSPATDLTFRTIAMQGLISRTLEKHKWNGRIVTRDASQREIPWDEFYKAVDKEVTADLTAEEMTTLRGFENESKKWTFNQCISDFLSVEDKVPGGDKPLFDPHCDYAVTQEHALHYFTLGFDSSRRKEWLDCFGPNSLYLVIGKGYYYGKDIQTHVSADLRGCPRSIKFDGKFLFGEGNMTVAMIRNILKDGALFTLISMNIFDPATGKCLLNVDVYLRQEAAVKVIVDLVTVPSDAVDVAEQQLDYAAEQARRIKEKAIAKFQKLMHMLGDDFDHVLDGARQARAAIKTE